MEDIEMISYNCMLYRGNVVQSNYHVGLLQRREPLPLQELFLKDNTDLQMSKIRVILWVCFSFLVQFLLSIHA